MIWCKLTSLSQVTLPHHSVKSDCYIQQFFVCLFVSLWMRLRNMLYIGIYICILIRRYGSVNAIANSYIFLLVMETYEKTQTAQILWDSCLLCQSWFRKPVSRKHVVHLVLMKKTKATARIRQCELEDVLNDLVSFTFLRRISSSCTLKGFMETHWCFHTKHFIN